jgi:2-iminobutanoate/2-iminopropanoate deaminase
MSQQENWRNVEMQVVRTDKAPLPIGPYSQAVRAGDFLFISGQGALDPKTKAVVDGGIEAQTRQTLENLKAILASVGLSLGKVVKVSVFLKDMKDYRRMNDVYGTYFKTNPPSRTTVQAHLPVADALVEIDAIAYFG